MSHENGESKFSHLVKDRQKINPYQNGQKNKLFDKIHRISIDIFTFA